MVLFCLFFKKILLITLKPVLEGCNSLPPAYNIDISDIGLAIMARMSEVNDEKIRAPKHVGPWSVRYSSGRVNE